MNVRFRAFATVSLVLLLFGGCSQQREPGGSASRDDVRPQILAEAIHSDAVIATAPRERIRDVDVAAVGSLVAFEPGPTVRTPDDAGSGFIADRFVLARVEVQSWLKGRDNGSTVLVAVPAGAEMVNADLSPRMKPGARSPVIAVEQFRASIPVGTRVVVMADAFHPDRQGAGDVAVYDVPQAGVVLDGHHSQAMSAEDDDGSMSEWPGYTFEEMTQALSSFVG